MRSKRITHPVPYLRDGSVCQTQCEWTGLESIWFMLAPLAHQTWVPIVIQLNSYQSVIYYCCKLSTVFLVITTVIVFVTVITVIIKFVVCIISRKKLLMKIYGLICQTLVLRGTPSLYLQLLTYKECFI